MSTLPVFSGVPVARLDIFIVLYFVNHCLFLCPFLLVIVLSILLPDKYLLIFKGISSCTIRFKQNIYSKNVMNLEYVFTIRIFF